MAEDAVIVTVVAEEAVAAEEEDVAAAVGAVVADQTKTPDSMSKTLQHSHHCNEMNEMVV